MKRKRQSDIPVLSEAEVEILKMGRDDPNLITQYFFKPKSGGGKGWTFDENFDDDGKWQLAVHKAQQRDIIVVGGFGTGKTTGIAMSMAVWALTTHPDFKALNAGPTLKQAKLLYDFLVTISRGTRFEDLIYAAPETPYPKIEIRFYVGKTLVVSTIECMSVSENADIILGWEGDWANLDEAFLNDDLEGILTIIGSRLRGSAAGRKRLGRLSMITNSHDNFYGWYLADLAAADPENYLTMIVSSRQNHNVTDDQLKRMLARIPPEERARYVDGERPTGQGIFFNKERVWACEDVFWGDFVEEKAKSGEKGYTVIRGSAGIQYFSAPRDPARVYMLFGDPGTGDAPARNAPCLMAWDVTEFPVKPAKCVAFWWGGGGGEITPFLGMLLRFIIVYHPVFIGVDSTGPQKSTAELINIYFGSERVTNDQILRWLGSDIPIPDSGGIRLPEGTIITGLDFSGAKKPSYLVACRIYIEAGCLTWARSIAGIASQLTNYDPARDRSGETQKNKIAQDIVSTMSMAAFTFRVWFHYDPTDFEEDNGEDNTLDSTEAIVGVRTMQRSTNRAARSVSRG